MANNTIPADSLQAVLGALFLRSLKGLGEEQIRSLVANGSNAEIKVKSGNRSTKDEPAGEQKTCIRIKKGSNGEPCGKKVTMDGDLCSPCKRVVEKAKGREDSKPATVNTKKPSVKTKTATPKARGSLATTTKGGVKPPTVKAIPIEGYRGYSRSVIDGKGFIMMIDVSTGLGVAIRSSEADGTVSELTEDDIEFLEKKDISADPDADFLPDSESSSAPSGAEKFNFASKKKQEEEEEDDEEDGDEDDGYISPADLLSDEEEQKPVPKLAEKNIPNKLIPKIEKPPIRPAAKPVAKKPIGNEDE